MILLKLGAIFDADRLLDGRDWSQEELACEYIHTGFLEHIPFTEPIRLKSGYLNGLQMLIAWQECPKDVRDEGGRLALRLVKVLLGRRRRLSKKHSAPFNRTISARSFDSLISFPST